MDEEDYEDFGVLCFYMFVIIIPIIGIIAFLVHANLDNIAEGKALRECRFEGYETFIMYTRTFLSSKPIGLVCGTLKERMIYEGRINAYMVNNATNVILSQKGGK